MKSPFKDIKQAKKAREPVFRGERILLSIDRRKTILYIIFRGHGFRAGIFCLSRGTCEKGGIL